MHHYITILSIAIILYMICALVSKHFQERKYASKAKRLGCQSLPAPSRKWLFGVDRIYQNIRANKADLLLELIHERYRAVNSNTYTYSLLGNKVIATAEPQNIQAILVTQFDDFCLGALRRDCFMPLLGNGIFTQDGEAWKHSRAILRPQFSRGKTTDLEMEERHVQDMMSALPVDKDGWTLETDLQLLFFRYALDSTCEAILGDSPGSQVANLPKNSSSLTADRKDEEVFAAAFDTSQAWLAYRARSLKLYWLSDGPEFRRACETVHDFIDSLVCKALDKWSDKRIQQANLDNQAIPKYTFLHALIAEDVDRKEIRFQLLHILLAGRDTTACFLGWTFYLLARHPEVYRELRLVVLAEFGSYDHAPEVTSPKLKGCQYLQFCLNEALRLNPPIPVNYRRATRDTTLPCGGGPDGTGKIFVRKDQQVDYSVYVLHRRKDIWGEDAEEFNPERWSRGRLNGWEYLPFNRGPRICLGQQLAQIKVSYVVVRLIQRFDTVENLDPDTSSRHCLKLTSCPANGVKVRLREAIG